MRPLALTALLACGGCSLVVSSTFNDGCNVDQDCAGRVDGGMAWCTSDHLCVNALPEEKLCTGDIIGGSLGDPRTRVIAGLFRLSGSAGDKDTEMANAARLAVQEINANAGTDLQPIAMVFCDTAGDTTVAARSLEKAARVYHAMASVGPTTSGQTLKAVDTLTQHGVLMVSPSATSPAITSVGDNGLIWRTCASDNLQANNLSMIPPMTTLAVNVAYVDTPYGVGLKDAFVSAWTKRGGSVKAARSFATGANTDQVVQMLGSDSPDYSLLVADDDASKLVASLYKSQNGLGVTQFMFTDGAKGPNLIGNAPNLSVAKRIQGTAPADPSGGVFDNFRLSYVNHFGSNPADTSFVANTYDATYIVAMAVEALAGNEQNPGLALSSIMARVSPEGGTGSDVNIGPVDLPKAVTALRKGGTIKLHGTSDPNMTFDGNGDDITAPIEVWAIDTTKTPPAFCTRSPAPPTCP